MTTDQDLPTTEADDAPRYPYVDPELLPALHTLAGLIRRPLEPGGVPAARALVDSLVHDDAALTRGGAVVLEEHLVPGTDTTPDIPLLVLRPADQTAALPAILYIHGGGGVAGNRRSEMSEVTGWIERIGVVVVSVDYRLAPEHTLTAMMDDVYAGLVWTAVNAADLRIDPTRLMIAGSSAGGALTAVLAAVARDRGGPAISHQILLSPALDDRCETPSSYEFNAGGMLDHVSVVESWKNVLGEGTDRDNLPVYASAARIKDLTGLPPAFIEVGTAEPLRDEALEYATRLSHADVPVELHVWPGAYHGSVMFVPDARLSQAALATREMYLARAVG